MSRTKVQLVGDAQGGANFTGVVTATSFSGDGSNLTGITAGATLGSSSDTERVVLTSLTTGTMTSAATNAGLTWNSTTNTLSATNVSIAGTLTYEDVTNVDSIGIVTARSGIEIGSVSIASTLNSDGSAIFSGIVTVTTLVETSSIALKENINPIVNSLDKVIQLNPVTYDRKNNISKNEAGLIAEEVNEILPNIVSKDGDGNPNGINYTKLSVYLIDAIKTLKKEIEDLRNGNS